jgi:para-aminobenzoate synthetase/4-amino-4-deoxychorismate lyase
VTAPAVARPDARARRVELDWRLDPARATLVVRGDERPFALLGDWAGGGALIGSKPVRVADPGEDPFSVLDDQPPVVADDGGTVGGGWFGYLGYALGQTVDRVDPPPPRPVPIPPAELAFYDHLLRLDVEGRWWFEALWTPGRDDELRRRLEELHVRAARLGAPRPFATASWSATPSPSGHAATVAAGRERIHAGDLFQANLCLRLESRLDGDPIDLFATAAEALRPSRAAFLAGPWGALASLSPELFLTRRGREVCSAPIKGTRPVGERAALVSSAKDRAENTMIVDLVRNDLGRVCEFGSVRAPVVAEARRHTGVWHLVSEVTGRLRDDVGDGDLVRACFPPGSVTGAPKVAAMDVIAELESTAREAYTGAIGFAGPLAGLELSVVIRTFEAVGDRIWLGVGGGVVADSDPEAEAAECLTKARPLLDAIGGRLAEPRPPAGTATRPLRLEPRPVPRPNPALGVFDTLLVREGRPVAMAAHLDRLARSVDALYGRPLPATARSALLAAAAPHAARARVRVDVRPGGEDLEVDAVGRPLEGDALAASPLRLAPVTLPGGLGAHKWADRRLLDALARHTGGAVPLLVDLDGLVLESAWASVFAVDAGGAVLTPPLDGRILPGIARARVIAALRRHGVEVREQELPLARLLAAREAFVTNAIRGAPAVVACGAASFPGPGPVTELAQRLSR